MEQPGIGIVGVGFVDLVTGASLAQQALSERPLTICGDGTQTRSIQYVNDLIEGTIRLMKSRETRLVNVGNPQENTVREIAQRVIGLSGSESELLYEPLPQEDDPKRRCPQLSCANEVLGWEPRIPAHEDLRKSVDWFAQRLDRPPKAVTTRR